MASGAPRELSALQAFFESRSYSDPMLSTFSTSLLSLLSLLTPNEHSARSLEPVDRQAAQELLRLEDLANGLAERLVETRKRVRRIARGSGEETKRKSAASRSPLRRVRVIESEKWAEGAGNANVVREECELLLKALPQAIDRAETALTAANEARAVADRSGVVVSEEDERERERVMGVKRLAEGVRRR